jgi:uncharacterized membrane protein
VNGRVGQILLCGVLAAFGCLAIGIGLWLAGAASAVPLLNAGIVILMATPFVRVLASALEFAAARDWWFALAATVVLAILLVSMFYSRSA